MIESGYQNSGSSEWARRILETSLAEVVELPERRASGLEKKAQHFTVVGRVQGVGFRYFVYRHANSLHLGGWVRNKENGDVEAHVEGRPEDVLKLERLIRKGPSFSFVSECRLREVPVEGFVTFSIAR